MSQIALDDATTRLLEAFAQPGESVGVAIRRALTMAYSDREAPSQTWLVKSIAAWLEFEGLELEGGARRLANHILNNWEMVRTNRVVGPNPP